MSNAITLLLSYSIEANLCIVSVMSVNLIQYIVGQGASLAGQEAPEAERLLAP